MVQPGLNYVRVPVSQDSYGFEQGQRVWESWIDSQGIDPDSKVFDLMAHHSGEIEADNATQEPFPIQCRNELVEHRLRPTNVEVSDDVHNSNHEIAFPLFERFSLWHMPSSLGTSLLSPGRP